MREPKTRTRRVGRGVAKALAVVAVVAAVTTTGLPVAHADIIPTSCNAYSGVARDVYARPLAGVTVAIVVQNNETACTGANQPASVTTGTNGAYTVYALTPVTWRSYAYLTAARAGYVTQSVNFSSLVANDFIMPFDMTLSSPAGAKPSTTFSVMARTTAPGPNAPAVAKVIADTTDGALMTLTSQTTDAAGYTTWTGTLTTTGVEHSTTLNVCAVDSSFTGTCNAAGTAPAVNGHPVLLSTVASKAYVTDGTAPEIASSAPAAYESDQQLSAVDIDWFDPGFYNGVSHPYPSDLDMSSIHMLVDGVSVPQTVTVTDTFGQQARNHGDVTGIAPGVHQVTATAADNAGNTTTTSYTFTVTSMSASASTATLESRTVRVNPNSSLPPPTTVTFANPVVDVGAFTHQVSLNGHAGVGTFHRAFTLAPTYVDLVNESGIRQTVAVTPGAGVVTYKAAMISPIAGAAQASMPASQTTIASITLNVPVGYNTSGSTATLRTSSGALGSVSVDAGVSLFAEPITGQVPVYGSVKTCMERRSDGGQPTRSQCATAVPPALEATIAGTRMPIFRPVTLAVDGDADRQTAPDCTTATGACPNPFNSGTPWLQTSSDALEFGCPVYNVDTGSGPSTVNLCTAQHDTIGQRYAGAYVNAWVFSDPGGGYPVWQQNHLDPGSGPCPNGRSGNMTASVYRAATSASALDDASGPLSAGLFKRHGEATTTSQQQDPANPTGPPVFVALAGIGTTTYATDGSSESAGSATATTSRPYQIKPSSLLAMQTLGAGDGYYAIYNGSLVDALGTRLNGVAAGTAVWSAGDPASAASIATASDAPRTTHRLQLPSGVELIQPGAVGGYAINAGLDVQLILDYSTCG